VHRNRRVSHQVVTSTESKSPRAMLAHRTASPVASSDEPGSRIWLYRSDGTDAPVDFDSDLRDLGRKDLLWADVDIECAGDLSHLWEKLEIAELVAAIDLDTGPTLIHQNSVLQLTVKALRVEPHPVPMTLHCLVGPNWVVTFHKGELDLVDEFNKPFHGDTRLGDLNGPSFLSLVLDWQISGYFGVIENLQTEIDQLDEELLTRFPDEGDLLQRLQGLRTRVRKLRSTLGSHRDVLGLLSHPRSDALIGAEAVEDYKRLEDRLQQAIDTVDTTREMIVGSFDIFMTRTAQTTNDIMKRLTIVSVLLLPAAALAGIMGMNFEVEIFEWPWMFWVTIALMLIVAGVTLVVAKRRRWL
jgi:magnesium transporter